MKRIRLSTSLLLVVIAALCFALVVQERRAARRDAEHRSQLADALDASKPLEKDNAYLKAQIRFLEGQISRLNHASSGSGKVGDGK
jgi:cell division protein FtsB